MRHLEEEGLAVRIPFRGSFVRQFTNLEIHELNSLRGVLEGYAAELIITKGLKDLSGLSQIVRQMDTLASEGNMEVAYELHISFHRMVIETSSSELLLNLWTRLFQQFIVALRFSQFSHFSSGDGATFPKAHQEIINALKGGNIEDAQKIIRRHVSDDNIGDRNY